MGELLSVPCDAQELPEADRRRPVERLPQLPQLPGRSALPGLDSNAVLRTEAKEVRPHPSRVVQFEG
ncbi:unnamed protein product [Symbiodinium natans]|uniref:Uncharacterized protein n=1 Tax=Symbiodinium natans TaxID=878477 RepID=A0A812QHG0_9DINO|nr:unnamed protein product [Symbiodinium natans]